MSMKNCSICIFGASSNKIDRVYTDAAFETGRLIALSGRSLVFGAGTSGLMGAAARGCFSEGGRIIGVIPEKLNKPGIYYENCTEKLVTPTMHERKAAMESMSSGFIALAGGFGTIEELMEVLTLKQLGYTDHAIVILNTNGYFDPLIRQLEKCVSEGFAAPDYLNLWYEAEDPKSAVEYCLSYRGGAIRDKLIDALAPAKNGD